MGYVIGDSVDTPTWARLRYVICNETQDRELYLNNIEWNDDGFKNAEGNGLFRGNYICWSDAPYFEVQTAITPPGTILYFPYINVVDDKLASALTGATVTYNIGSLTIPSGFFVPTGLGGTGGVAFLAGGTGTSISSIQYMTTF